MLDLATITGLSLSQPTTLEAVKTEIERLRAANDEQAAAVLFGHLQRQLPSEAEDALRTRYRPQLQRLSILALPALDPTTAVRLVSEYLPAYLADDKFRISKQLGLRLGQLASLERTNVSDTLRKTLESSAQSLTTKPMAIPGGKYAPGTVANWLRDFKTALTTDQAAEDPLPSYFARSSNASTLEPDERRKIEELLRSYLAVRSPVVPARVLPNSAPAPAPLPDEVQADPGNTAPLDRVTVRDDSGAVRFFRDGHFVDPGSKKTPASSSFTSPSLQRSVMSRQTILGQRSNAAMAPVSYDLPEEEEEIRRNADRLTSFQLGDGHDITSIVDRIIMDNRIDFADPMLARRFRTIAEARLKDIRSSNDTLELLTRTPKVGGIGFEQAFAATIMAALEKAAATVRDELPAVAPKVVQPPAKPVMPSLPHIPAAPAPLPTPIMNTPAVQVPPAPAQTNPMPAAAAPRPFPVRLNADTTRPRIEDIRAPAAKPRLFGPVDELRALTLEEFRQGGEDAGGCVRKVYEKIMLLSQESFGRHVEGVRAWRQSPVHQLYLSIGRESLEKQQEVATIAQARQAGGQPTLTETEYHAIVDLNRKLRF